MGLFDRIAPFYGLFFNFQVNYYNRILDRVKAQFDIGKYETVLDIGCGTGALCSVLRDRGLEVIGIDTSKGMLRQAREKTKGQDIEFIKIKSGERLDFNDKSFDIVIASYLAHGLEAKERLELYREMKRISKEYVIIYDYNKNRGLVTTIVEWLENGDYFNFIKNAETELEKIFKDIKIVDVDKRASWYICKS